MKKKINGRVSAFWHLPFIGSGCTMISEPDISPDSLDSLEHGLEVCPADLNGVEVAVVKDGDPVAVAELGKALDPVAVMDFAGDKVINC